MSTISIVDETQKATLKPGFYWIEMAFDRPTTPEVLLRALSTIGFRSVGLEMEEPSSKGANIGAGISATASASSAYSAHTTMTAAPTSLQSAHAAPAPPKSTTTAAPAISTISSTPMKQVLSMAPSAIQTAEHQLYGIHDAVPLPKVMLPSLKNALTQAPSRTQATPIAKAPSKFTPHFVKDAGGGGGDGGGGGGDSAPAPSDGDGSYSPGAQAQDAPLPDGYVAHADGSYTTPEGGTITPDGYYIPPGKDAGGGAGTGAGAGFSSSPNDGTGGWNGDDGGSSSTTGPSTRSYSVPAGSLPPLPKPPVTGAISVGPPGPTLMWLCPPGTKWSDVTISGRRTSLVGAGPSANQGSKFRFMGELGTTIDIKSLPGLRWTIVHSVNFDPWGAMSFRLTPHELVQGQLYDLRFLSRDKTAKTKESVMQLLIDMGFRPVTLFLSKRNMRIPGRPLTTLSEWFGVGVWAGADSIITSSDPFYFAEVRPTT